jgi:hypothetical protein
LGYPRDASHVRLKEAVRRHRALSREGLLERLFGKLFHGLVYTQIWEDPDIDLEALALTPDCLVVAIASGGCNVLSYLTGDPARITAVDLGLRPCRSQSPEARRGESPVGGQEGLPRWFRSALRGWLALFHVRPRDELRAALAARAQLKSIERPFRGYAQYAICRRLPTR